MYSLTDIYASTYYECFQRAAVQTNAQEGMVALLTALLAVWINFQQQGLKSQQDKIDLTLKKESTTTLFADKILQQVNTLSEESSKVKGAIILELMGLDIQAHLESRTGEDKQLNDLEEDCKQIPSR